MKPVLIILLILLQAVSPSYAQDSSAKTDFNAEYNRLNKSSKDLKLAGIIVLGTGLVISTIAVNQAVNSIDIFAPSNSSSGDEGEGLAIAGLVLDVAGIGLLVAGLVKKGNANRYAKEHGISFLPYSPPVKMANNYVIQHGVTCRFNLSR